MADVKILLVEDENIEAMDIKRTLESFGYEVPYVASSGEEAVEKALEIMPDLILIDMVLKGDTDGIDVASKIKNLNIPVIYLTAHSEESTIERTKLTEPYGYIIKPYDRTELKYAIELAIYKNQMEKELKESEKKFYLLFENSPLPYQSLDENGFLLDINPAWLDILGYSKDEVIGKNFADFLAPGYKEHFKKNFPHFKNAGEIHEVEFEMKHKDGSQINVSYEGKIGYDELGNFKQTHCIFHDITQQKKAEKSLKVSENKYHAIFDNASDGIFLMKGENIIECNEKTLEIYKVTRKQIIGQTPYDFSPELQPDGTRSKDRAIEHINKALDGYPQHFNWKHLSYDGIPIYSEITLNRIKIENEYLIQAIIRDVTEQEEAKKVLKESKQRLTDIINFLPDATFAIDLEGKVIAWNNSIEKMTGTLKEDIIGKGDHAYSIPWYGERRPILIDLIKLGNPEFREKYEYIHKQGKTLYAEVFVPSVYDGRGAYLWVTASPLLNSKGEQYGAIESVRDITERKKAEISLKKSAERFRAVAESAIDAIVTTDENGKIIFFNHSLTKIFGYTKEDLTGKPLTILMPIRYHKNYLISLQKFKESGKHRIIGKTVTTIGLKKDKSEFPFEMSLSAWKSEQKIYFTSIIRDLSERQKAEKTLKESETYYRTMFENTGTATIIIDKDMTISQANTQAEKLSGYSKNEIEGKKKWTNFIVKEELDRLKGYYALRNGPDVPPRQYETKFRDKHGNIKNIHVTIATIPGTQKELASILDITENKKVENALKESKKKYKTLFESNPNYTILIGSNGVILDYNGAAEQIIGISKEKLVGKHFMELEIFPEDELDLLEKKFSHLLKHEDITPFETRIIDKNGEIRHGETSLTIIKKDNMPDYILVIFSDITERKKAEKELLESEGLLRGLFDNMPSGISVYQVQNDGSNGSDYIIKEFNVTSQKIEGMTRENVIGKSLKDIRPEIDEYGLIPIFKEVWETGKPIQYPAKIYVDEKFANYYQNYVFKAPTGEIVAIYEDVTKQENAKEALKKQTAEKIHANILLEAEIKERKKKDKIIQDNVRRLNIALESADMGAWDLDLVNYTTIRTLDHDKIFGYDTLLPEWDTKIFFEHILPEDRKYVQQRFEKSYDTKKLFFQCRIIRADKEIRWIEVYGNVYNDEKDVPIRILGVISDITERKEAETHLLRAIDEKEMLLREIHHRVKNNMQIISSFLSLQSSQVFDKRDTSLFINVQDRVKSMALIHDNLYQSEDISSIQIKEYILALTSQLFATYSTLSKNIKLITDIMDITLNMETAIPLGLIISEMVTNSLKHAFPNSKGEISISLHTKDEETELIVNDNGIGVPKDFDIQKPKKLGLQLLKTLVEQLEGTIKLDQNEGTTFKITFKELKYKERI